jgi:hypothetical protein
MNTTAHDLIIDQFIPSVENSKRLTTWYAQGLSDGLGDRLLMFDNTNAPSWEILRFKPALARDQRFEAALRRRVESLSSFQHPAFPTVRPITELGQEEGLAVVSTYQAGVSLSEGLKKPKNATFAVRLLRQLVPAVSALQQHATGLAHGALTVDRLMLTAEGRLMVREHMVGAAIQSLELPEATLWREFGILVPVSPASTTPALDERCDVVQLALVVLSLMSGRRFGPEMYPDKVGELLDQIEDRSLWHEPEAFRSLRRWLERALQLGDDRFASARDANAALSDLQDEPERTERQSRLPVAPKATVASEGPAPPPGENQVVASKKRARLPWRGRPALIRGAVIAVSLLALGEAVFIGRLLYAGSGQPAPAVTAPPVLLQTRTDPAPNVEPRLPPIQFEVAPPVPAANALPVLAVSQPATKPPEVRPAVTTRSGGFRVSTSIEVHVLDGERVLGSSGDGPIILPAGRHELEFVNSAIGYRARRVVDVKAGQIASLAITVPNGTLSINATPWAAVWIDGNPSGETPLGNLSITPGEHEILFRHPQFGERREKVIVRADASTRVAVTMK